MVLESDDLSELLSAAHTVATAAIADAGIAMSGLGVGCVIRGEEGDDGKTSSSVTLGVLPALNKVTNVWMTGVQDIDSVCDVSQSYVFQGKRKG